MNKQITLAVATRLSVDQFWVKSKLAPSLKKLLDQQQVDNVVIFDNNSTGLSTLYNKMFVEKHRYDIVVLCHDDVEIHDLFFKDKLYEAITKFDVIGLAGASSHTLKSPVVWHLAPREHLSGSVTHVDNKNDLVYSTYFGHTKKSCVVLDGVFLAINMEKFIDTSVRFDDQFDFHFYDLNFCISAYQKNLKLGTWNIYVVHHSIGDFRQDPKWYANEEKYIKKFSNQNKS